MEEIQENPTLKNINTENNFKKKLRKIFRCFCIRCFLQKSNCELCNNCKFTINVKLV